LSSPAAKPAAPRVQRHVRNYILDPKLQLRYVLAVLVISALIAGGLGYLIWNQKAYASRTIIESLQLVDWIAPELKQDIIQTLHTSDNAIVLKMAGVGVGMFAILTVFLIVLTHKVAGPLYKIGTYFDRLREGDLSPVADLRKGDQFQAFFQKFKAMHEELRQRARTEVQAYDRFLAACETAGVGDGEVEGQLDALRALRKQKEEALG
jgi:methyl-accepting chemotaxis protein